MQIKAQLRYLRIAPRKVRLVADLIRGKSINEAKNSLEFSIKKSQLIFLQPTRITKRKAIERSIELVAHMNKILKKDNVLVILKNISSSNQAPRKSYGNDNRNQTGGNYRRRG